MPHKHYEKAYRAHTGTSFSPEKRAKGLCKEFDETVEYLQSLGIPQEKISKYESLWLKWLDAKSRCYSSMITGPANFPVARMEKLNRYERNAGDASLDYYNKIVKYAKEAKFYEENPEARPILDGDADALERLEKKVASLTLAQETMKAVNAIVRKKPIDMKKLEQALGSKEKAEKLIIPDCFNQIGFASYALNNNRASIKATQERLDRLKKRKDQGDKEIEVNGVKVVQNSEAMRIQLFFNGKPPKETIELLKSNAFKWAPGVGAWQRQLTNNAVYSFNHFVLPHLKLAA